MDGAAVDPAEAMEARGRPVLHPEPPDAPRATRLPGTGPVGPDEWLLRDEVFAEQMALRDRLVEVPGCLALMPRARDAAGELLDAVLERIGRDPGYRLRWGAAPAGGVAGAAAPGADGARGASPGAGPGGGGDGGPARAVADPPGAAGIPSPRGRVGAPWRAPADGAPGAAGAPGPGGVARVLRPDGVPVDVDRARPMATLARLVQEDLCVLLPGPEGHVLAAGALLFPSFWRLPEKLGRSLVSIHVPVEEYDEGVAARVQRLFDAIRPGRPLCRWNWLFYDEPRLHQPRDEAIRREAGPDAPWLRRERQCLLRLPRTGAVVFTIHTFVVPAAAASMGR